MTTDWYWTEFDGDHGAPQIMSTPSDDLICRIPISTDASISLGICDSIKIIGKESSKLIYQPKRKGEVIGMHTEISPDRHYAVASKYIYRGGGILDLTIHWIYTGLLIVNLDANQEVCEIPVIPIPRSQLAFAFANDSTLILLNDGVVTAYNPRCH